MSNERTMGRGRAGELAVRLAVGLTVGLVGLLASASLVGAGQSGVAQSPSPCAIEAREAVWPPLLLGGERARLTIALDASCPGPANPLHVVLVLDGSSSMAGEPTQRMKDAVRDFVGGLDLPNNPSTRVGIVEFKSDARTLCQLTNEAGRVLSCIGKIGSYGGSAIDRGIGEGIKVMRQGRNQARLQGRLIHEAMVVLTDGESDDGCEPVLRAAGSAKSQGVLVIAICVGPDCDAPCMRRVAQGARRYHPIADMSELGDVLDRVRDDVTEIEIRKGVIVTELGEGVRYVAGSSEPPADVSPDGKTLEWQASFIGREGMTVSLEVEPLASGFQRLTRQTHWEVLDRDNGRAEGEARPAWVSVFGAPPGMRP